MESKEQKTPNLAKVIKSLGSIPKDTQHALGYSYASVDAVFSAVRPKLAAEGITILMDEIDIFPLETFIVFKFRLKFEPVDRDYETVSVMLEKSQVRGAQSVQAARSFALKYWLRGRLLLDLGEPDADAMVPSKSTPPKRGTERAKSIKEGVIKL